MASAKRSFFYQTVVIDSAVTSRLCAAGAGISMSGKDPRAGFIWQGKARPNGKVKLSGGKTGPVR